MDLMSSLDLPLTPASNSPERAESDIFGPPLVNDTEQLIRPKNRLVVHNGACEFQFNCAEKLKSELLEDILINFEGGNFDAFVGNSFYVTQELASHYMDKMREWKEINSAGMHYLGQKKVVIIDSASREFYAIPLAEILSQEKESITLAELEKIIAEENFPFKISKNKIIHTGRGDLENEVIDLYVALAERGMADRIPENFFEAKVEGFAGFSAQRSAEEQQQRNYLISNGFITRDGKYLTLEGVKRTWGDKEFKRQARGLGVKDPRRIMPLCAMLGLSLGLVYAGATFSGFPHGPLEAEPKILGGERLHAEGEVQSEPVIWGDHAAWFDASVQFNRELSDIVIKNITSGEIETIHANGNERSDIVMRGDYIIWQERDRSILDHYARHSVNYHNILTGTAGKVIAPTNMSDESIFGEKLFYINKTENSSEIFVVNLTNGKITQITSDGINKSSPKVFGDFIAWYQPITLDNGSMALGILVKNMKTNISTKIPLLAEDSIGADFDVGSKYLVWIQNGRPAETVTLLGHSELAATVDVFKLDLQTSAQSHVFSYGMSSLWDNKVKVSDELAVWNAGKPRPFRLEDGRSNHRSGVFAYNLSSNQRGPISDDYNADFNIYGNSIVWTDNQKIYVRQMDATNWRYVDNYFNKYNRNLLDLNSNLFNLSSLQNNKTTAQDAIERLIWSPSAGVYLGLAAGYFYYELNVFSSRTQSTKWNEIRHRLANMRKV